MPDFSDENVTARFADQAMGLSVSKLLHNIASGHFLMSPGSSGEIFSLDGHGYKTRLWSDGAVVYFKRNNHVASRPINFPNRSTHLNFSWSSDRFQLAVWSNEEVADNNVCETVSTPEQIYVPNTLITWARKQNRLPRPSFGSVPEVMSAVIEAKQQIEQRVRDSNMYSLFWDYDRSSGSCSPPRPKREPQVIRGIVGFLQDDSINKGYTVIREGGASSGNLDAQIIASLTGGGQARIAIEAKNAHSPDLGHGLRHQLPEYMRAINANYGFYLVLWYKCDVFDQPTESAIDNLGAGTDDQESDIDLQGRLGIKLTQICPLKNIYTDFFRLSLPTPPSAREFEYS